MPFYFYYDPTYILVIPALILAIYAQAKVQGTFNRYLRVRSITGQTGGQVAQSILSSNGAHDVAVEGTDMPLGDHFDPRTKTVRLSPQVYRGSSIASLAVAAHESGHAMQDKQGYAPLAFRQAILPVANFGSRLALPLFILGMLMGYGSTGQFLMSLGIWLFAGAVAFQLITLPVEFNASRRALTLLADGGHVTQDEVPAVREVLQAAALTYVAASAVAVTQLLRLLILRGSRRD
ncbi:MAG: zinc metallopeptidase [Firmicutes bacterium]|nr:zinc metallopeptidase [Bacillota bacterium]MDD4335909.1 zinc metallopeptidase [Bacillota bacterium]MDD4792147.1 zinc metallopeptidase [Bacillota bacterium]